MDSTVWAALIVGACSIFGTIISSKFVANVRVVKLEMRMESLEKETKKHNGVMERTYELEKKVSILEHDVDALESVVN